MKASDSPVAQPTPTCQAQVKRSELVMSGKNSLFYLDKSTDIGERPLSDGTPQPKLKRLRASMTRILQICVKEDLQPCVGC